MVVYVTPAEKNGGILQFSTIMLEETLRMEEALLFLPDSVDRKYYEGLADKVVPYKKIKTIRSSSKRIKKLADEIAKKVPDRVVLLEDSLLMQQINHCLVKKKIKTAVVVHDVIRHPYRNMTLRKGIVEMMRRMWMRKTVNQKNAVVLLSNNSKELFEEQYKKRKAKIVVMILGAHVPGAVAEKPEELPQIKDYYLFFGRINKYKGIANLCRAYAQLPANVKEEHKLIIAGTGPFSEQEIELIEKESNIIKLHRFIDDGEMIWLYENARGVVLPYIEASQSGVLPIAYHFSKPVIVSNQRGLLENLKDGSTGWSYKTIHELTNCLQKMTSEDLTKTVSDYYTSKFNWTNNIGKMLEEI